MKLKKIITIGYEGADFGDFLHTLKASGVDLLLDIREFPMSRRRGFAKTALRQGLGEFGISYRHEPWLGSPKLIRHRLRDDGNYKKFFKDFDQYLETQRGQLEQLSNELAGTIALLCYERDHKTCHRSSVAALLSEITGITVEHRGVQGHAGKASAHSRANFSQGVSAA